MIKIIETFFGSQLEICGSRKDILEDLTNIVRGLYEKDFDKEELLDAVKKGFEEDPTIKSVDGDKVSDEDIHEAVGKVLDSVTEAFDKIVGDLKKKGEEE